MGSDRSASHALKLPPALETDARDAVVGWLRVAIAFGRWSAGKDQRNAPRSTDNCLRVSSSFPLDIFRGGWRGANMRLMLAHPIFDILAILLAELL